MKRTQLNINIDPDLLQKIKSSARKSGKSLVEYITDSFQDHLYNFPSEDLEMKLNNFEQRLRLIEENIGSVKKINKQFVDFTPHEAANYSRFIKAIFEREFKSKKYNSSKDAWQDFITHFTRFDEWNEILTLRLKEIIFIDHADSLTCNEINSLRNSKKCPSPLRTGLINWINNSEKECCCNNNYFPSEKSIGENGTDLISNPIL